MLVALLVTLIPTTIGGLLSAIGIAGMDRLVRFNVIATSGRAVEAAGDVDTLLLDKTGTITFGNRMATDFLPVPGVTRGRTGGGGAARQPCRRDAGGPLDRGAGEGEFGATSADTRRENGNHVPSRRRRAFPASMSAVAQHPQGRGRCGAEICAASQIDTAPPEFRQAVDRIARTGGTPLAVSQNGKLARRHPPQGHREARHQGALRGTCAPWASGR